MRLNIGTPYSFVTYDNVSKIKAEGKEGSFTILPKHMDYISVIAPCVVKFEIDEEEVEIAVDEGILIKKGSAVRMAVRDFIAAKENETMKSAIKRYYEELSEEERKGREIMAKLEAEIIRNFMVKK